MGSGKQLALRTNVIPLVVNLVFDNLSVLISDVCLPGDKPNQSKFELSEIIILIGR